MLGSKFCVDGKKKLDFCMIACNNFYHHAMEIWSYAINFFFTGYLFKMCKCMCTLNFLFNLCYLSVLLLLLLLLSDI